MKVYPLIPVHHSYPVTLYSTNVCVDGGAPPLGGISTPKGDEAGVDKDAPAKKKSNQFANMPHPPEMVTERVVSKNGKVFLRKYMRGKMLGKGGFARCYEFTNCENGKTYAAKVVAKSSLLKEKTKNKVSRI